MSEHDNDGGEQDRRKFLKKLGIGGAAAGLGLLASNPAVAKTTITPNKVDTPSIENVGVLNTDNLHTPSRSADVIVWKDSSGTIHADGDDSEIDSGSDAATVIQSALDGLTSGRSHKEKVAVKGDMEIGSTLQIPDYTILQVDGRLTLSDGSDTNMVENKDTTNGNSHIELHVNGELDGNSANQTGFVHGIYFKNLTDFKINARVFDTNGIGILLEEGCRRGHITAEAEQTSGHGMELHDNTKSNAIQHITIPYFLFKDSGEDNSFDRNGLGIGNNTKAVNIGLVCVENATDNALELFHCEDINVGQLVATNPGINGFAATLDTNTPEVNGGYNIGSIYCKNAGLHAVSINQPDVKIGKVIADSPGTHGIFADMPRVKVDDALITSPGGTGVRIRASSVVSNQADDANIHAQVENPTDNGFFVNDGVKNVKISGNVSGAGKEGVVIANAGKNAKVDVSAYNSQEEGIRIRETTNGTLRGNFYNNSQTGAGSHSGVLLASNSDKWDVSVHSFDDQGSATQKVGVEESASDDNLIHDTTVHGHTNTGIFTAGSNTELHDINGYVVANKGSETQSGDGSTATFTIAHGLDDTPSYVSVDPGSADANGDFHVSSVDGTNIELTYSSAPASGTDNLTWYWRAEV